MSSIIPSDQFLLYCFDGAVPMGTAAGQVRSRARREPALRARVARVPFDLDYPHWAAADSADVLVRPGGSWEVVRDAVADLFSDPVDPYVLPWRMHLFGPVDGAPRCSGPATVAVLQVSHALADGRRAADLARALLSADTVAPQPFPVRSGFGSALFGAVRLPLQVIRTVRSGLEVADIRADLDRRTEAGELPPPAVPCPPTALNVRPGERRDVRPLVRDAAGFAPRGVSVTVAGTTAVSLALERYLRVNGDDVPRALAAEVTVARPSRGAERNSFRNVSVPLHPGTPPALRLRLIARSLAAARERAGDPAWDALGEPDRAVPAALALMGIRGFDPGVRPDTVGGATVVSSVSRGPADLELCGAPVAFTAGFPALSPVMGVTHGIHGLTGAAAAGAAGPVSGAGGGTVTVTVTSAPEAVADPDRYAELLGAALDEVRDA